MLVMLHIYIPSTFVYTSCVYRIYLFFQVFLTIPTIALLFQIRPRVITTTMNKETNVMATMMMTVTLYPKKLL